MNVKTPFINPHSKFRNPSVPIPESWNPLFTTTTIKTKTNISHELTSEENFRVRSYYENQFRRINKGQKLPERQCKS